MVLGEGLGFARLPDRLVPGAAEEVAAAVGQHTHVVLVALQGPQALQRGGVPHLQERPVRV